jgi:DNA invertase Pin-like site-specific DNA recombinase
MKFIAYYRVSTAKQGKSGLGLEAQQNAVNGYITGRDSELLQSHTDIESGSKDNRPELQKALRKCRLTGATLLIAKLDRLSRNRRFLMDLQDSTVNFVCCDMPEANNFTVGLLACLADYERELISERTRAALQAAKARGVKLGNPSLNEVRNTDTTAATKAHSEAANKRNSELRQVIKEIQEDAANVLTLREVADKLNEAGYKTARGAMFHATTVNRIMAA